ncbi:MAG: nucleoside hydrolase [Tannerellaceae bacterium]|jgi:inosine-uridine nucleoside N-ribohydrolase|nr:nucleoside hydrolase [Tannerellaceae bacterium]
MKTYLLCSLFVLVAVACGDKKSNETAASVDGKDVVNLILDTDLGPDYDDVGAMTLMHALADSGLVTILATVSSNKDERVIPCIEVLNHYFNRPAIPVGAPKSEGGASLTTWHKDKWTDFLPSAYAHKTQKTSDAPDAVTIYRRILSEQEDHSVTICTLGFFTNLKDLLLSQGDEYSPLSGKELVERKVKHLVSMAAQFPEGREFNVYCDTPASKVVIGEWPTEIIFSGFEIGEVILTGKQTANMPVTNSPVKDTYEMCLKEGDFDGRNSWDQTAVLVAIKGYEPYYSTEKGTVYVGDDGANTWSPSENGKHIRLIEQIPPAQVASLIESYMMHQPVIK